MKSRIEFRPIIGGALVALMFSAIALPVIVVIYFFIWVMAYPAIGYQCESSNIVEKVELAGDYWTGSSKYKLTFTDGTEYYSTYEKVGAKVCIKESAKFLFWEAKSE